MFPEYSGSLVLIKFLFFTSNATFTFGALTVIHSQKAESVKQALSPMIFAAVFILVLFCLISLVAMATFGRLIVDYDTIIKSYYIHSKSFLALVA